MKNKLIVIMIHFHRLSNLKSKKLKEIKAAFKNINKIGKFNKLRRKINKKISKICKKIPRIYKILSKLFQTHINLKTNNRMYNKINDVVIVLNNKKNLLNLEIFKIFNNIEKILIMIMKKLIAVNLVQLNKMKSFRRPNNLQEKIKKNKKAMSIAQKNKNNWKNNYNKSK